MKYKILAILLVLTMCLAGCGEEKEKINMSNVHTDFMIGTSDLEIEATTNEGKKLIFTNGNFNI